MRVTAVGCTGSLPGPESPASCYLVQADWHGRTWSILLDLGSGAFGALQRHVSPDELDGVLLTHLHPDHCLDVCSLYVYRRHGPNGAAGERIPVVGPEGVGERLARAYGVTGPEPLDGQLAIREWASARATPAAVTIGPFTITPFPMRHSVETFGLRVEAADGTVLAYTGDTDLCDGLTPLMRDADLVLSECAFIDGRDTMTGVHLSGSRSAYAAARAGGIGRLVLTHLPPWNDPQVCLAQARAAWPHDPEAISVCRPGAAYEVGAG